MCSTQKHVRDLDVLIFSGSLTSLFLCQDVSITSIIESVKSLINGSITLLCFCLKDLT